MLKENLPPHSFPYSLMVCLLYLRVINSTMILYSIFKNKLLCESSKKNLSEFQIIPFNSLTYDILFRSSVPLC